MPRTTQKATPEVFAPAPLGPLTLRNRIIKAATFEGVMPGGKVSDALIEFHRRVAAGGAAMSTVAYLAVSPEGRTDRHCLLLDDETVHGPPPAHRRHPRRGRRGRGPDRPRRPGRQRALQPRRRALAVRRVHPDGLAPPRRRRRRHRAHRRGLSRRRAARRRRRLRQHRGARRPQLPAERVLEPEAQQAQGPVRRLGGEPCSIRPHRPAHGARRRGRQGGRHGEAEHGRRRRRRPLARRERRGRHPLRGRRHARCARAHRRQLARQPDVPLPGRRAAPGVRARHSRPRCASASRSSATAS